MIDEKSLRIYCAGNPLDIENINAALADRENMWVLHHKRETAENKSKKQLIAEGLYYLVPPSDLVYLTKSEHSKMHGKQSQFSLPCEGKAVVQLSADGKIVGKFRSINEAARHINISSKKISDVLHNRRKTVKGYSWRFE